MISSPDSWANTLSQYDRSPTCNTFTKDVHRIKNRDWLCVTKDSTVMGLFEWSRLHNQHRELSFARLPFSYHLWSPFLFMAFLRKCSVFGQTADWLTVHSTCHPRSLYVSSLRHAQCGGEVSICDLTRFEIRALRKVFLQCLKAVKVTFLIHEEKSFAGKKTTTFNSGL